jgi:hypothetical protein
MNKIFRREKPLDGQEQIRLEAQLETVFIPVMPSPKYIQELRHGLLNTPFPTVPVHDARMTQYIVIAVASFLSGTFLIVLGIRVIRALIDALGKLPQFKRQVQDKRMASRPEPAL